MLSMTITYCVYTVLNGNDAFNRFCCQKLGDTEENYDNPK